MNSLHEFFEEGTNTIAAFDSFATAYSLFSHAQADHIGYKCDSKETFEQIRNLFESESLFIYQSIISHRRIAIIRLKTPFTTKLGEIAFLELSDQKPDGSQKSGFDHVELYPKTKSVDELVAYIAQQGGEGVASVKPHHTTYNYSYVGTTIKIEATALIEKICQEEMN